MNPQLSFSSEDIKDNLSTPKFPKNKSLISIEKEENTLDTLKQQIDKVYNDKDISNNDNNNESKNDKNFLLNSLLNNNSNLDLNNFYMSQFSFDEKSSNFLSKKENTETTLKNKDENDKDKNIILISEENNENKNEENNNEIKYINKLTSEENEKNEDSNFDYELPLGSDDNPEFFYLSENNEEIKEKIKNENQKIGIGDAPPTLESKNNCDILTPKRQQHINKWNEKINSAKISFDENKLFKINGNDGNKKEERKTKYNSSNKKINKVLKFSSLIEENSKSNNYLSERNNHFINSNTYNNSLKNTNFTSKDINNNKNIHDKINNDKITIKPFMIEKIDKNEIIDNNNGEISGKNMMNTNIIKDITITYYDRKNKKNRNSINFMGGNNNNFLDIENFNKTKIIYEKKNLSIEEPRSFSITKKGTHNHSHSRNYQNEKKNINIKNETMTSSNYYLNKKIKNRVILLTKDKNRKNPQDFFNRNNSLKNFFLTEDENFSRQSLEMKNIEGKTERTSPFRKSRIIDSFMTKNSSYKNYILNNNQPLKNKTQQTIIKKHNKNIISQTFSDCPKEEEKSPNKNIEPNMNINNTYYNHIFKNKGNLTHRNKDMGPINIYSRKILYIPNANNNNANKLKQNNYRNIPIKKNTIKKKQNNKSSYIIPKEKNIKILQNENSNLTKNKTRAKFNEYFNDILSNINLTKTLINQRPNLNNKKIKEPQEKHIIRKIIQLSNIDVNTMTTKTIQTKNKSNNVSNKINKEKNKIKNINYNSTFTESRKNIIEMFRNNILNYSINRNNKNNQVKNEVSIFIGEDKKKKENKDSINNNKNMNLKKIIPFNNKTHKKIDKNKKTIINVNQYYSSYYIKK